jgi:hypothetical protein
VLTNRKVKTMFMTSEQLTAEQRVQKAVIAIMQNPKYVALAGILMLGDRTVIDDPLLPTACTNGKDEMYNREFVSKLNDAELRFLILHESYHKLYKTSYYMEVDSRHQC